MIAEPNNNTDLKKSQCGLFTLTYLFPFEISKAPKRVGSCVKSAVFSSTSSDASFQLEVYENGFSFASKEYICARLSLVSKPFLRMSVKLFVKGKSINMHEARAVHSMQNQAIWEVLKWIPTAELTVNETGQDVLNIGVYLEYFSTSGSSESLYMASTSLQKDMLNSFLHRRDTGTVLLVGNSEEVHTLAHKDVLIARSSYIQEKLASPFGRLKQGLLIRQKIYVDLPGGLLWAFLKFIYCDDINL
jgi:hypothetical protein